MKRKLRAWSVCIVFSGILPGLEVLFLINPTPAQGQAGQNAVYNSSQQTTPSPAFIDASMFTGNGTDICGVLKYVLANVDQPSTYPSGAVIDARGLNSGNTSMTCTASPWSGITTPPPSTILLPPTTPSAPIVIPSTWVLPPNTRLIGEGDNISSSTTISTTIRAESSFSGSGMIQFGSSSLCSSCSGISVENLTLDGQGQSIDGVDNTISQDFSYVDHVSLYQIRGTGLSVSGTANNSGPYSNITFDTGGWAGVSTTTCASINGLSGTHGIHGLTCISESQDANAAVYLDSSNNSIEDVRIVGFYDGILVGSNAAAKSNVLLNIIGDTQTTCQPACRQPVNAVHISSNHSATANLSIMGVSNLLPGTDVNTIKDDLTSTILSDTYVGVYALGNSISGDGYSRFTTSPHAATWAVGTNAIPSGTCAPGSLYSNTSGSGTALWVCSVSSSTWVGVK